ncbi:MAG: PQQ-binding-like beta-propeller repeat protein [Planctomycetaceae bacterium]
MQRHWREIIGGGLLALATLTGATSQADDWSRFRGPNGTGVSLDSKPLPSEWSDDKNLAWKTPLPGPGLSSPILVGDHVFVTCWSGYGLSREDVGNINDLQRHLVCVDRKSGSIRWNKSIPAVQPEEEYRGMFAENGYASHTPVSDGKRVFAFLGKSGIYAFDMEGKELWHKSVGTGDDRRGWGTASSPILYKELVIVPAFIESHSLIAFDQATGEEKWRQEAEGFDSTWGTPVLVDLPDGRTDLVIGVPYEIWGINPANGKLRWYSDSVDSDSICSSVLPHGQVVYMVEGRNGGAVAVRCGGSGSVTDKDVVWSTRDRGRISTPLWYNEKLIWVTDGRLSMADAATGDVVEQLRLERSTQAVPGGRSPQGPLPGERSEAGPSAGGSGGRGGFSRGGFGGRMGGQDYSSPIIADGKLIYITRAGDGIVVKLGDEPEQLATNRFASDHSEFSATPAVSDGQLFIRSNKFLYCVAAE